MATSKFETFEDDEELTARCCGGDSRLPSDCMLIRTQGGNLSTYQEYATENARDIMAVGPLHVDEIAPSFADCFLDIFGNTSKMSASVEESAIYLTDSSQQVIELANCHVEGRQWRSIAGRNPCASLEVNLFQARRRCKCRCAVQADERPALFLLTCDRYIEFFHEDDSYVRQLASELLLTESEGILETPRILHQRHSLEWRDEKGSDLLSAGQNL
eukprot:768646-Hanusia_phi.AAC.12